MILQLAVLVVTIVSSEDLLNRGWEDVLALETSGERHLTYGERFLGEGDAGNATEITPLPMWMHASSADGRGLGLVFSLNDTMFGATAAVSLGGAQWVRYYNRLGARGASPVTFAAAIVPLSAPAAPDHGITDLDCRGLLAHAALSFPHIFDPHPAAKDSAQALGLGMYSCADPRDMNHTQLRDAGGNVVWDASFSWPYQGLFLPPDVLSPAHAEGDAWTWPSNPFLEAQAMLFVRAFGGSRGLFRGLVIDEPHRVASVVHGDGGIVLTNQIHVLRPELLRVADGVFTEAHPAATEAPRYVNAVGLLTLRCPGIVWTESEADVLGDGSVSDADAYFAHRLYMGVLPMAPALGNDHAVGTDSVAVQRVYKDHGHLFAELKGSTWLLRPGAVSVSDCTGSVHGAVANAFEHQGTTPKVIIVVAMRSGVSVSAKELCLHLG
eukprot:g1636.t1